MATTGLTDKSKKQFMGRNKNVVNRVIRGHLAGKKNLTVHGTRATNAQLPKRLNVKTVDWDVKTNTPLLSALRLERKLDRKFRGNFFRTEEGATKRLLVHKVKSNVNNEGVADFSIRDEPLPFVAKRGVKFATLKNQFERAKENLKDPAKDFRRVKDLGLIRRVRKFEKQGGKLR